MTQVKSHVSPLLVFSHEEELSMLVMEGSAGQGSSHDEMYVRTWCSRRQPRPGSSEGDAPKAELKSPTSPQGFPASPEARNQKLWCL